MATEVRRSTRIASMMLQDKTHVQDDNHDMAVKEPLSELEVAKVKENLIIKRKSGRGTTILGAKKQRKISEKLVELKKNSQKAGDQTKTKTKLKSKKIKSTKMHDEANVSTAANESDESSMVEEQAKAKTDIKIEKEGLTGKGDMYVGAHVSAAGGLWNAVADAETIGAKSFALFLRSQRQWNAKPLEDEVAVKFVAAYQKAGFHPDYILPHGSYLLNCGAPDSEILRKSQDALLDEMKRCEKLGLTRYNFHPGSTCGKISVDECLDRIGECINMVLEKTSGVVAVVENMSCQGNTVGGKFEELKGIIDRVKDKTRIGVCIDTCHAFAAGFEEHVFAQCKLAKDHNHPDCTWKKPTLGTRSSGLLRGNSSFGEAAFRKKFPCVGGSPVAVVSGKLFGYDISTENGYKKMTDDFESIVGFKYLKAVHLNDSKGKVGCHLDRHENIGKGCIGIKGFERLMNDSRFSNIPMVLETPPGADYGKEIKLLYSLIGKKK